MDLETFLAHLVVDMAMTSVWRVVILQTRLLLLPLLSSTSLCISTIHFLFLQRGSGMLYSISRHLGPQKRLFVLVNVLRSSSKNRTSSSPKYHPRPFGSYSQQEPVINGTPAPCVQLRVRVCTIPYWLFLFLDSYWLMLY